MRKKSTISSWKKNFLKFFLNRNTLSKSPFWRNVLKKEKNYQQGPQNLSFPPICPVYRPVPFSEFYSNLDFEMINLFEIKVTFDDKVCVKFWNFRMLKRLTSLAGVKESRFNQAEVILLSEYHAKIQSRTFMNVGLTCNIWIKISKIERNFDFKKSARLEKQNCLPFSLSITYYTLSNFMLFGDPPIYLLTKYPKKKKN